MSTWLLETCRQLGEEKQT